MAISKTTQKSLFYSFYSSSHRDPEQSVGEKANEYPVANHHAFRTGQVVSDNIH